MKKVLSILAASAMLAVVACGPSAEEEAKKKAQMEQDSIEAAKRAADSIANMAPAVTDTTAMSADTTAAAAPAEAAH